ncbi:LysR family transcriptional regulator [Pseudoduganella namucuonensis]|uniref:Transcriptional regulator, LysR family n=1 Tax=Pseudoduganella namucuonensis TaxID=1035707 RepID=A0A1I7FUH4_9BURK|nr:LysR family transcriptional regulator [Pseudoduganella namucuonensis]SFU39835.1 transcriptional regulator, LysR family [Pseudoduganella namucuonensis]
MDKARVITLFTGVVRAGSFSRAAVEAGLSPQAVSKAIRQLEEHLGVRLFHRTTRSLTLTREGERLHELASPGLRLLDEALDQVRDSRRDMDGTIRIAAPTSFGNHMVVPLIRDFQALHPGVHFDLLLEDQFTDLVEARIDVGFRGGNPPERNLVSRRIGDLWLLVCAAPAYVARHGAPRGVDELRKHRCTGFRQPNTGRMTPWELSVDGATVYLDIPAVASFNTAEAEACAVLSGMAIGQLVSYMADPELDAGRLLHLLPETAALHGGVYMYYQQRTQMPQRVRQFIDYASERAPGMFRGRGG